MSPSPCVGGTHMFSGSLYHMMPHQLCNCGKMDVREALKGYPPTELMREESLKRDALISEEGLKHDKEKIQVELLSPTWLEGVGMVLTFGAKKYAAHNWRKGIQLSRLLGACLRHVLAFLRGEDKDPESGLSHLYHASCCLMFASEIHRTKPELDDRVKE